MNRVFTLLLVVLILLASCNPAMDWEEVENGVIEGEGKINTITTLKVDKKESASPYFCVPKPEKIQEFLGEELVIDIKDQDATEIVFTGSDTHTFYASDEGDEITLITENSFKFNYTKDEGGKVILITFVFSDGKSIECARI